MADKGFNLKVLIPTDDGLVISTKGVENVSYYLLYNVSNRSYQLAGKIKVADILIDKKFDFKKFEDLCNHHNVDMILTEFELPEIGDALNNLIDQIIIENKDLPSSNISEIIE